MDDSKVAAETPMQITKQKLADWSACRDGVRWFLKKFPQGAHFREVHEAMRVDRRYSDADWLIERVFANLDTAAKVGEIATMAGADKAKIAEQAKQTALQDGCAATTGEGANAATTGYRANAATTGEGANAATTGYRANAATTGNWANAATTGKQAIACCLGLESTASAGEDGAIVLTYFDGKRPRLVVGYVGEDGIDPGVTYKLDDNHRFVPVTDEDDAGDK